MKSDMSQAYIARIVGWAHTRKIAVDSRVTDIYQNLVAASLGEAGVNDVLMDDDELPYFERRHGYDNDDARRQLSDRTERFERAFPAPPPWWRALIGTRTGGTARRQIGYVRVLEYIQSHTVRRYPQYLCVRLILLRHSMKSHLPIRLASFCRQCMTDAIS